MSELPNIRPEGEEAVARISNRPTFSGKSSSWHAFLNHLLSIHYEEVKNGTKTKSRENQGDPAYLYSHSRVVEPNTMYAHPKPDNEGCGNINSV